MQSNYLNFVLLKKISDVFGALKTKNVANSELTGKTIEISPNQVILLKPTFINAYKL